MAEVAHKLHSNQMEAGDNLDIQAEMADDNYHTEVVLPSGTLRDGDHLLGGTYGTRGQPWDQAQGGVWEFVYDEGQVQSC